MSSFFFAINLLYDFESAKLDQVTFANFSHDSAEELSALLIEMIPLELTRIFFTDNGSTAVEAALKMTLQACEQNGFPEKKKFLAFSSAYHGDTVGAMSVSSRGVFTNPYHKVLFDVIRASHPTASTASVDEFVHEFENLLQHHHKVLAGVIVEPLIQAAGGMIVWPDEALRKITKLCKEYGVYLIFDEVMTGFGERVISLP